MGSLAALLRATIGVLLAVALGAGLAAKPVIRSAWCTFRSSCPGCGWQIRCPGSPRHQ